MTQRVPVILFFLLAVGGGLIESSHDPCLIYSTYTDEWRMPSAEFSTPQCDNLNEGWYTFYLGSRRAYIPTTCLQEKTCSTEVPMRVNLEGQDMPGVGETINASLCGSDRVLNTVECCVLRQNILIKHCENPPAFIYYLKSIQHCNAAICAIPVEDDQPDRKYRFEPGDVPLSLQTEPTPPNTTISTIPSMESSSSTSTTMELALSASQNTTEATPPENTTVTEQTTQSTSTAGTSSTAEVVYLPASSSTAMPHGAVTLILLGDHWGTEYQEALQARLKKACRMSTQAADPNDSPTPVVAWNYNSGSGFLTAFVTISSCNVIDGGVSDKTVQNIMDLAVKHLPQNTTLLAACTSQHRCRMPKVEGLSSASSTCLTSLLLLILIIIISVIAFGLLIFGCVRMYKHYSKRGTWKPPPDQKGDEESGDASKHADMINGGDPANTQNANGPVAGRIDDTGFDVVPLDQAPHGEEWSGSDKKTMDTHM